MEYITQTLETLSGRLGTVFPKILGALLILILGMWIAGMIRRISFKALKRSQLDERFSADGKSTALSTLISKLLYYLLVIFVLMTVLNMLGITTALDPLKNMLSKVSDFIPNLIAAGIIGYVGYILANVVSEAAGMLSSWIEKWSEKYGLFRGIDLSNIIKKLIFIIIFIPMILIALDTLDIRTISEPAKAMITTLFESIPNIIAAVVILIVFFIIAKLVAQIIADLSGNLNIDKYSDMSGVNKIFGQGYSLSKLVSNLAYFFIMFFGIVTAVEKLEFRGLSEVLNEVLSLSGHILFGAIILIIGNQISRWVSDYFTQSDSPALAAITRFATLGLFLAISLRFMNIADDIVNLAFGLTLGAVAVAFALSFGLGGREAAGRQMEKFFDRFK